MYTYKENTKQAAELHTSERVQIRGGMQLSCQIGGKSHGEAGMASEKALFLLLISCIRV